MISPAKKSNFVYAIAVAAAALAGLAYYMLSFDYNIGKGTAGSQPAGSAPAAGFSLDAKLDVLFQDRLIYADMLVRNQSPTERAVVQDSVRVQNVFTLEMKFQAPDGKEFQPHPSQLAGTQPFDFAPELDTMVELLPQSALSRRICLSNYYNFDKPGRYELAVSYAPLGLRNSSIAPVVARTVFEVPEKKPAPVAPETPKPAP